MNDQPTSQRLTQEDLAILALLQGKLGLKRAQVIKLAIRKLAEQEKLTVSDKTVK